MPLSPEEESQIEIDGPDQQIQSELSYLNPQLSADEEASIVIDPDFNAALDSTPSPALTPEEEAAIEIDPKSVSVGGQRSVAVGRSGIPFKGPAYEEFRRTDARLAAREQDATAQTGANYDALAEAQRRKADIESEHYGELSKLLTQKQNFLQESADLDQLMHAEAKMERQQYLDTYMRQLAAVRQMSVQSPMGAIPGWQFAGAVGAAFAQGFLGAQGININPIAQIDKFIERDIEEQRRRIDQAERGAQDTLNLYQIARDQSRDDLEARQRYRGMVLEQFSVAVEAQANRFGSVLAKQSAEVTKAQLGMERDNTIRAIGDNYEQARLANMKAMREEHHTRVMEGFRAQELAIQRKRAEAEKAAKPGKPVQYIFDARNVKRGKDGKPISGGLAVAELQEGAPTETQKAVIGSQRLNDSVQTGLDKLRRLHADLDVKAGPGWARRRTSNAYARFDAERSRVIGDIQRNFTGLAATDKEAERWLNQLKDDSLFQLGADRLPRLMDDMGEWSRQQFESTLQLPGVRILPENERGYNERVTVDPETAALAGAREKPYVPSTIEHLAGAAVEKESYSDRKPSKFYQKLHPFDPGADRNRGGALYLEGYEQKTARTSGAPETWAVKLEDVAKAAAAPEKFLAGKSNTDEAKALSENPQEIRTQALMMLGSIARGEPLKPGQPAPPAERQEYAKKLLDAYEKDPNALWKALSE